VLTAELKSAQLIIKLLQDELKTKVNEPLTMVNQPMCVNLNPQDKLNSESGWIEIWRNNHVTMQLKKTSRCLKQLTPYIPLDENRFSLLSNLQDQVHHPTYGQDKPQPTHLSKISGKNRRKVILLGDSHIRGCSDKLADLLGNSYSVIGITKPNANLSAITDSINLKRKKLTSKDTVILCGGTRDIAKNEANIGLRHISQFAKCTANTNVIVMSASTHYDLHPSSCVNKEVESFNRKLQKLMKIHNHIRVCSMSTNRDHFTIHGLHINTQGKNWITHTWASLIKTLTSSSLLTSIPLPEKNKCKENPVFPVINSCVNNMRDCVDE